jgi:DNA polymerase III subunit delta
LKLASEQLASHLAGRLAPVYLVSGDDPLLCMEALDAIRLAARRAGFDERLQLFIERSAAVWEEALAATQTLSLFASRRILEIRMPGGKPGHGAATLLRLIAAAGDDLLVIVLTGRLDRDVQGSEWVRAVQERGVWLPLWPIDAARLPGWLRQRLRAVDLAASDEAIALLAEATEGNLLAARQEIDKLLLRFGAGARLDAVQLAEGLSDSARFDIKALTDALQARDAPRALRVLASLRAEGAEEVRILWWLVRALHEQGGRTLPMARLVARATRTDRCIKGRAHGSAWDEMGLLCVELCGQRTLPLPRSAVLQERARA